MLPFVGDDACALTENFMEPYSLTGITVGKRIFNNRLSRARRLAGNTFEILVSNFGKFERTIALSCEKSQISVSACCYFFNYSRRNRSQRCMFGNSIDVDDSESGTIGEGNWRTMGQSLSLRIIHERNSVTIAKDIRESYCDLLNNDRRIHRQHKFA